MAIPRFSLAAMEQLLKSTSTIRISDSAKIALRDYLEKKARRIGIAALALSKNSKRKTIREEDIRLAAEEQHAR